MESRIEYNNDNSGIKVSLENSTDLPSIEVYARHIDGLVEKIEKGMRAVSDVANPDAICMEFTDHSNRKANEIQADYDTRSLEQKQIKIIEAKDGHSYDMITKDIPLEKTLEIMNKEYGGFSNFKSSHFHWGENPIDIGARKKSDADTYFTSKSFDELWDIYKKSEIMGEIRKRGFTNFKQISSTQPNSDKPLFLDIAKAVVPIMAPNDKDYIVIFSEPVAGGVLFFNPSEFNSMSKEEILKHYQDLIFKRNEYMKSPEYVETGELMQSFIQGITGLGDKVIDKHTTGSSQGIAIEQPRKPRDIRNKRF